MVERSHLNSPELELGFREIKFDLVDDKEKVLESSF